MQTMLNQTISTTEVEQIRAQMLKFAQLQVRDPALAEDLVQDALLSSLQNIDKFQRQAALKTWMFAILKNKIIDYLRQKDRYVLASDLLDEEENPNQFFDEHQHWKLDCAPQALPESENQVYSEQFWLLFETCLEHLPAKQARVFMMREYLELPADQVCLETEISSANLHTLLHRARLQLQHCLTRKLGN